MKARREQRKQDLLKSALFLPFEAQELSQIKKPSPYFNRMIMERRALMMNAKKYNWSEAEKVRRIKAIYINAGAVRGGIGIRKPRLDPWALLRVYEDKYKDRYPQYETPTAKKTSKVREFNYDALKKPKRKKEKWIGKPYG
jgi:hypothetical protein